MPSKKKRYNARFPAGRIKKIMQTDDEVGKVAQAVPVIISRTLELFVQSLITKTMEITTMKNARTLSPHHMKQCILSESRFDFLKDLVKSVPEVSSSDTDDNWNENSAPPNSHRRCSMEEPEGSCSGASSSLMAPTPLAPTGLTTTIPVLVGAIKRESTESTRSCPPGVGDPGVVDCSPSSSSSTAPILPRFYVEATSATSPSSTTATTTTTANLDVKPPNNGLPAPSVRVKPFASIFKLENDNDDPEDYDT